MSDPGSMLHAAYHASHQQPLYATSSSTSSYDPYHLPHNSHSAAHRSAYHPSSSSSHSLLYPPTPLGMSSDAPPSSPLFFPSPSPSIIADDNRPSSPAPLSADYSPAASSSYCTPPRASSSSSAASLSVSTVPRLLHPFFASSDLLSHSAALFTLADLLTLATLNRCIAALARSERIWRPRLQAAIATRYPASPPLSLTLDSPPDEHKQMVAAHRQQSQQQGGGDAVQFTCPYLSAMRQNSGQRLSELPPLISPNPFVSDLVQQLEASTAKETQQLTASSAAATSPPPSAPLLYDAAAELSSSSLLSSKARYIAMCQCALHGIVSCSRLVSPLPPLPAPSSQAHWAHTRVLHYPAPPSLDVCDQLPTLPLCAPCRAQLAVCMKDYYDYRGEWAGQFTMTPLSLVIIQPPDLPFATATSTRPVTTLDVRYSHIGGYDGIDHRRFEVEYIKAAVSGCTCGCGGLSAGASSVGEWSVRVMHRYRSGIYAMDSPLNVVSNDRLSYSHLRERERFAQRKRKNNAASSAATATAATATASAPATAVTAPAPSTQATEVAPQV